MEKSALVYIILTILTVGFALLVQNETFVPLRMRKGYGMGGFVPVCRREARNFVAEFVIYALLAGVSACRIAVGNDYWVYRFNFRLIAQERHVSSEIGFNLVVKWFQLIFGYDNYLPIFGFFSLITVYFFLRALHDQGRDYAFALFLLMTGGYYFNSLNSVRYYLALAMALYAMKYVLKEEFLKFVLVIAVAAVFHKSVLLVIPVYIVAYYLAKTGPKKWQMIVAALLIASLFFGRDLYRYVIFKIYPFYENSVFDNGRIPYANVAKCLGALGLSVCAFFPKREKWTISRKFYFTLNLLGLITFFCGSFVPEVTRIGYYMIIPQIFLIPELVGKIENKLLREFCRWGTVLSFTLYFGLLLHQMYRTDIRLLPYLNWIFN